MPMMHRPIQLVDSFPGLNWEVRPMKVKSWHPGQLSLLWGLSLTGLALLLVARPESCNHYALGLWLSLIAPLGRWTWIWFDYRKDGREAMNSEGTQPRIWRTSRVIRGLIVLGWIVLTVWLAIVYWDCGSAVGLPGGVR